MTTVYKTQGVLSDKSTKARNILKAQHPQAIIGIPSLAGIDSFVVSGKITTDYKCNKVLSHM